MAKIKLLNSYFLEDYGQPFFVAEVNTSHFGDLEIAKKMINKAKEIGCNCVKFQSWSEESLYSKDYYNENPIAKRFVKKFSLSEDDLLTISNYCYEMGIFFASTPYSNDEVDFLINKCNVPYIKIASMELNNYPFLSYIGKTGYPIVLSTGMGEMDEVRKAIKCLEKTGNNKICILHCVSIYPPDYSSINLRNIEGLREEFPNYPIGFSDHSIGVEVALASIALGACMIEKHFTLDKSKIGMDNQMALEANEMRQLVDNCNNVKIAIGEKQRILSSNEIEQRGVMRRSVIAIRNLKAGETLKESDLGAKRPGTGLPPERIDSLVGKTLTRDIDNDSLIKESDYK